ncbi:MAG TPA: HAMP domain-containing protein, partial [Oligoflexia bacterium]|nr:HAMP domain-containing protein [Oligoflexia bacterium]
MTQSWNFPIRYKILGVLSVVVCAAVAVYLYLASTLFFEDKTLLIYELNQSNVRVLANEMDTHLKNLLKQSQLIGEITLKQENIAAFDRIKDDDLVAVRVENNGGELVFEKYWTDGLEAFNFSKEKIAALFSDPFPKENEHSRIQFRTYGIQASDALTPPLLLTRNKLADVQVFLVSKADSLVSAFTRSGIAEVYVFDANGDVLFGSNSEINQKKDPLYSASRVEQLRSEVRQFDLGGKQYLGSWYRLQSAPLVVASRVELGHAFAAARLLIRKSIIYAVIIVTVAFMVALIFSQSLTEPIHRMMEATYRIAKGDFNSTIHVRSHDELAVLAASFNAMTVDLRSSRSQIEEYSRDLEKKVIDRTAMLETQNAAIREAQEALLRTTRLASVGEVAGRAAHEVLNPLTNIIARLEKRSLEIAKNKNESLVVAEEILAAWKKAYDAGGIDSLCRDLGSPSSAYPGQKMIDEDLKNIEFLVEKAKADYAVWRDDIEFLNRESLRISKIVNGMRSLTRVSGNRRKMSVVEAVEMALNANHDVIKRANIQYSLEKISNPSIVADRDELVQVLSNLLRNSMQSLQD